MDSVDNNQFEVKPVNSKRKITVPCPNVYLNPALDLLVNEDPMCNTAMEIVPNKKRKRTKSCDVATFENSALDLGISKTVVNKFLVRELENVRRNVKYDDADVIVNASSEIAAPIDAIPVSTSVNSMFDNVIVSKCINPAIDFDIKNGTIENTVNSVGQAIDVTVHSEHANSKNASEIKTINNTDNFIDTLHSTDLSRIPHEDFDIGSGISVLEQKCLSTAAENEFSNILSKPNIETNVSNQVIISNNNISLSFIDRLALDSPNISDQSLFLDDDLNESNIMEIKTITIITKKKRIVDRKNTNPFLDPNLNTEVASTTNPFLDMKPDVLYQEEALNRLTETQAANANPLMPRRLFSGDTNSTVSTMNESSIESQHEYENIDSFRADSPIYENIEEATNINKQSKILGYDVSQFSAIDIMNLNKINQGNNSNQSQDSKKDLKHSFLKASNKLSKKVFKSLKKTFKNDKANANTTLNPYEVPRKVTKQKAPKIESGIENPGLNLDNSDDLEIEELSDEEHQYETVKTRRNTQLNMNVTPLKVRDNDIDFLENKTNTPGKKVRFDSTLNLEKIITGNSFDCGMQSPGFDAKIDKYHDELENCINERKFIQQNM